MTSNQSQNHILKINLEGHDALTSAIAESDLTQDLEWDKIANLMHNTMKKADGLVVGSLLSKGISEALKNKQNPVIKLSRMVKELRRKII